MTRSLRHALIPLYLFACLVLGGSTRSHVPNLLLQLAAIAILAWAAMAPPRVQSGRAGRALWILVAAAVALVALQLLPLPPGLWSALPGRGPIGHGFDLLGVPRPWLPLSLAPYDTMASALWLLPPVAMLAGMVRLGFYREPWLVYAMLAAAFAGVLLGALQVASSDPLNSPWYPYAITNNGQAAGLFANSHHMAILLVAAVPFLFALHAGRPRSSRRVQVSAGRIVMAGGALLVLLVGIALSHSLAGVGLAVPVLGASLLVPLPLGQRRARLGLAAVGVVGLIAVAAMFASPLNNNLTAAGAENDYSSRYTSFGNSLRATADHFPVGSGLGSFADLYPTYENPAIVDRWFVNHVHNDYIELALETGLPGVLLMIAFLLWWVARTLAVWRAPVVDRFARAATIASAALLAHSLVEFPLRTSGLAAVFAMCLGLMIGPRRRVGQEVGEVLGGDEAGRPRHLSVG